MARLNKYTLVLLLSTVFCYSCNKKTIPERVLLDYSYDNGWTDSFSIKVYSDGKAFLKKSALEAESTYANNHLNIKVLKEITSKINTSRIDNKYEDTHIQDAPSFNAIVYTDKGDTSKYYVYGNKYPDLLNEIRSYSNASLNAKGWHQLKDTVITFNSLTNFKIIPKIDTSTRFLPPKADTK